MQHLLDWNSVQAFLGSARRHLRADGRLVLDVMNPSAKKLARGADEPYAFKSFATPDGATIHVEARSWYCADVQQLRFTLTYREGSNTLRTKEVAMRCFFPEELLALCRHNGLEVTHRFGDYDERSFSAEAPKQILVCR
jgi:hypothetical protein